MLRILIFVNCCVYSLTTLASESVKRQLDSLQHQFHLDKRQRTEEVYMDTGEDFVTHIKGYENINTHSFINQREFQTLLKENLNEFIKSLPKMMLTAYPVKSNLQTFYLDTFRDHKSAYSISNSQTASESLANILLELENWVQIGYVVEDHIKYQFEDQFWEQTKKQLWEHMGSRTKDEIKGRAWDHLTGQVTTHLCYKVFFKLRKLVSRQLKKNLWDHIALGLKQFSLSEDYENGNRDAVLKAATDFAFISYQLGALPMKETEEFKEIKVELVEFISRNMTEEQIYSFLNNINIPEYAESNYLLAAPVELIKIMLPSID